MACWKVIDISAFVPALSLFWRDGRCNFVGGLHVVLTPNHLFLNSLLGHPGKARRANEINAHNRLRKEQLR